MKEEKQNTLISVPARSLSLGFSLCAPQSIYCHCCLRFGPHTSILCHWSKYKLLTTPIFPQNSDKTREWAGVLLLKPLSLLFYYYSPQRPQLRPAISLKPVRVSATRMDRLMGGRRCLCEWCGCVCVCMFTCMCVCVCVCTYVHKPKVAFMLHVFEFLGIF